MESSRGAGGHVRLVQEGMFDWCLMKVQCSDRTGRKIGVSARDAVCERVVQ